MTAVSPLSCLIIVAALALSGCGSASSGDGNDSNSGNSDGSDTGGGGDTGDGGGTGSSDPPVTSPFHIASPEDAQAYQNLVNFIFAPLRDTMSARGLSDYDNVITHGSVQFDGYMNLVFVATPVTNLMGDATLSVDLATGAASGLATGFMGVVLDDEGASQYVDYLGDVTISDGTLNQTIQNTAEYTLQIDGTLENGVSTYGVNGNLNGYIFGDNADALRVIGMQNFFNDDITMTVDGVEITDGTAGIWATRD